jgi:hypothetical protein
MIRDTSMYISKEEIEELCVEIKRMKECFPEDFFPLKWHSRIIRFFKKLMKKGGILAKAYSMVFG